MVGVKERLSFTDVMPFVSVRTPDVPSATVGVELPPVLLKATLARVFAPTRFRTPPELKIAFPVAAICCGFVIIVTVALLIVISPGITVVPANPARARVPWFTKVPPVYVFEKALVLRLIAAVPGPKDNRVPTRLGLSWVAFAEIVIVLVVLLMAVIVVPAGIPVPEIVIPMANPAVEGTVTVLLVPTLSLPKLLLIEPVKLGWGVKVRVPAPVFTSETAPAVPLPTEIPVPKTRLTPEFG